MPPTRRADPKELRGHWELKGNMGVGAAFSVAGGNVVQVVPCAGAARIRVRIKTATLGGTLQSRWLRPDGSTEYTANNPADVIVVAGTENKLDVDPHFGEGLLQLTFVPAGTGTFTYVDVSQV